jgi:hypothetical protein
MGNLTHGQRVNVPATKVRQGVNMSATEGATARERHEYDVPGVRQSLSTFGVSELIRLR